MTFDARRAYLESAVRGAPPTRLVVLLYEAAISDLQRALAAVRSGDVERRTAEIGHALAIVGQLQATLDLARGGEVAQNLDRFYSVVRAKLLEAQIKGSAELLEEQSGHFLSLRDAWLEVEKDVSRPTVLPNKSQSALPPPAAPVTDEPAKQSKWSG